MSRPHASDRVPFFSLTEDPIAPEVFTNQLRNPSAGARATFEGWVRNHHQGKSVLRLRYEAYPELASAQGDRIVRELAESHRLITARCIHRVGILEPGEIAIWIGAVSAHREAAFSACRAILERVKSEVPIWKQEFFSDGTVVWVDPTKETTPFR